MNLWKHKQNNAHFRNDGNTKSKCSGPSVLYTVLSALYELIYFRFNVLNIDGYDSLQITRGKT